MSDRLRAIYERVTTWQRKTFPHQTAASILAHMRKELKEIKAAPYDIEERADMAILAMGYADRTNADARPYRDFDTAGWAWGMSSNEIAIRCMSLNLDDFSDGKVMEIPSFICACSMGTRLSLSEFIAAISAKMDKNEARKWPSPAEQVPGEPVEHIREELQFDAVTAMLAADKLDEAPSEVEILRARVAELEAERAEWRADNERLRAERQQVREVLGATPFEGALDAARRHREGGR